MADLGTLLKNEVQDEIETIKRVAAEKAAAIVDQAKAEAESLIESRKKAFESHLQASLVRAKSAADLEAAALRLSTVEEGMSRAFTESQERIRAFTRSESYRNILGKLALEAKSVIGEVESVEVHPSDVEIAREALSMVGIHAPVHENMKIETGLRLVGKGGRNGINNTLLGRLDRVRDSIAPTIAKLLRE